MLLELVLPLDDAFEDEAFEVDVVLPLPELLAFDPVVVLELDDETDVSSSSPLQPINVLELVTFYPMFRQSPVGKHHIRVCRTLSCAMAGGYQLLDAFCRHANIEKTHGGKGHLFKSADGKYSVEFVECLASCGTGPVCMINDDFYEAVSEENVPQLLDKYQ